MCVTMCATTFAGFSWASTPNDAYFTLSLPSRTVHVTDDLLRGGWWNAREQRAIYGGKNLFEFSKDLCSRNPEKTIRESLPDVWMLIEKLCRESHTTPSDGIIIFNPDDEEKFDVSGQRYGYGLDRARLSRDILSALKSGQHRIIHVQQKMVKPTPKKDMLKQICLRGGYKTYFNSYPNREHNIMLALKKFHGLVIAPGQTVSFNQTVGPRSQARGFKEAKIIMDGAFIPGVGGGVCQASTTLFNALLLAGVQIDKSYNHSLPITYVPLGRDAMVSSMADLKFTNDTGEALYIETETVFASGSKHGHARVTIYGAKPRVKYKPRVVMVCPTQPCVDSETPDDVEPKKEPRRTRTYLDTYKDGQLVQSKLVRKSSYK